MIKITDTISKLANILKVFHINETHSDVSSYNIVYFIQNLLSSQSRKISLGTKTTAITSQDAEKILQVYWKNIM